MKTKFILLLTAVITLGSLSSCVAPYGYGGGYGYNNYYPWFGGFGGYNNYYYTRPGYAYGGYRQPLGMRGPYAGRPGFTGYRSGFGGYHSNFAHSGGFGGFHGGGFAGHHR